MKYLRFFPLALLGLLASCDIVEAPYVDNPTNNNNPDTNAVKRMVLVEEFTGIKCPNCPEASHFAKNLLKSTYKDKMILVAIHAGNLAKPNATGDFTADYRTDVGTTLWSTFQLDHVPVASVNRTLESGVHWLEKSQWESRIAEEALKPVEAGIEINTSYNDATRALSVTVESEFLVEGTATENLLVYLIEDGIVSPQDSAGEHIHDYEHEHMLRASLNTIWGENLSTNIIPVGTKISKQYNYTVPADINGVPVNVDNCSIVAFVHNNDTKIVRQAAIKKIKP